MRFADIIGQVATKEVLLNSYKNNHIAHAQLFLGKEGGANLMLALAYMTFLNCQDKQEDDACGVCGSCRKFGKLIHPDLNAVFPQATSSQVKHQDEFMKLWRSFVLEQPFNTAKDWAHFFGAENKQLNISVAQSRQIVRWLSLKPFEADYKVLLIWLPEYMAAPAANALLKILEEPPPKTIFLLVCNQLDKLLATIISRCQIVQIPRFTEEEVSLFLQKREIPVAKSQEIALLAEGNIKEALRLSQNIQDDSEMWFRDWMRLCFLQDYPAIIQQANEFGKLGKEAQKGVLMYGLNTFREAMMVKFGDEKLARVEASTLSFVKKFSKVITQHNIFGLSELLNNAYFHIERNANAKILFVNLSIQISQKFR